MSCSSVQSFYYQSSMSVFVSSTLKSPCLFSESRAISKYILRKYKSAAEADDLLREGDLREAAMVDVWTEVEAHQYNPALSPVVYECVIHPAMRDIPTNQKVVD